MGVKKLVHTQLDSIYSTAKDLCDTYDTKTIPINMIEKLRIKKDPIIWTVLNWVLVFIQLIAMTILIKLTFFK